MLALRDILDPRSYNKYLVERIDENEEIQSMTIDKLDFFA